MVPTFSVQLNSICLTLEKDARRTEIQLFHTSLIIEITLLLYLTVQMATTSPLLRILYVKWFILLSSVIIICSWLYFPIFMWNLFNNYLYAKFGVDTLSTKILRLTENINSGHLNVYLFLIILMFLICLMEVLYATVVQEPLLVTDLRTLDALATYAKAMLELRKWHLNTVKYGQVKRTIVLSTTNWRNNKSFTRHRQSEDGTCE